VLAPNQKPNWRTDLADEDGRVVLAAPGVLARDQPDVDLVVGQVEREDQVALQVVDRDDAAHVEERVARPHQDLKGRACHARMDCWK
jgi:hypothetical protein